MRTSFALVATLVLLAAPRLAAQDAVEPADRTDLGLTVYDGFAQVRDTRRVSARAGDWLVWAGIPDGIDPGTIVLRSEGRRLRTGIQALDADVTDPGSLMEQAVGRRVTLVGPDGARTPATLVSPAGPVFRVEDRLLVGWDGAIELPEPPGGVRGQRVVRWRLSENPAAARVTATYLTDGLSWAADYLAVLSDATGAMDLEAHVSVRNGSGTGWSDATLQLVAGDVRRFEGGPPRPMRREAMAEMAVADAPDFERERLGEVHLYTLDRPVTLERGGTTRVELLAAPEVPVERELILRGRQGWIPERHPEGVPLQHPEVWISFDNAAAAGLGEPLPAGVVHVYREDARDELQFAGEAPIPHTPADERVRLRIGEAFDVVAERTQTAFRRIDERTRETTWRIEVRNHEERARTVQIYEPIPGEWEILEENLPHERIDAQTARWTLRVPAGGSTTLEYRLRITR